MAVFFKKGSVSFFNTAPGKNEQADAFTAMNLSNITFLLLSDILYDKTA